MKPNDIMPLASLIIPVFNNDNFIEATLASAIGQSYQNLEIIIINDGSTDNSRVVIENIIQKNPDSKIRLINQTNSGVSVARNTGIENAKGDYLLFCDGDDLLSPDYVEYLVCNAIKANAEISISTGIRTNYSLGNLSAVSKEDSDFSIIPSDEAVIKMLTYYYPIGCYCRAFHKSLFAKDLQFIPGQKVGEGFTFNIKAMKLANRVVVGYKPIYCYRRDNESSCMTDFNIERAREAVNSIKLIKSLFDSTNPKLQGALDFAEWHTIGDMYNWMALTNNVGNFPQEAHDWYKGIKVGLANAKKQALPRKEKLRLLIQSISPKLMVLLLAIRKQI